MQKIEHCVQDTEHHAKFRQVDWDDLQLLQEVATLRSFRRTAERLGVSVNTVRSHVDRLEASLGLIIFARTNNGVSISEQGVEVLSAVLEMQTAAARLAKGGGNRLVVRPGEIRISTTEGLGELWLTPRLAALQHRLPGYRTVLNSSIDQKRIHSNEFDLSLGFEKPGGLSNIVSRVATLHFIMYASKCYLAAHGVPKSLDDAKGHRLVVQSAPGLIPEAQNLFLGQQMADLVPTAQVNTSYSLFRAIRDGVGIGALPTYISSISSELVPLDLPIRMKFDLWMSYDQSFRRSAPVRAAIDWVRECFDLAQNPWFDEKLILPGDFPRALRPLKAIATDYLNPTSW